jgi:hypothetical protein
MTQNLDVLGIVVVDNPFVEFVSLPAEGLTADVAGVVDVVDGEEHVT